MKIANVWLHKSKISFKFKHETAQQKKRLYLEIIVCDFFINGMGGSKCFKVLETWNFILLYESFYCSQVISFLGIKVLDSEIDQKNGQVQ